MPMDISFRPPTQSKLVISALLNVPHATAQETNVLPVQLDMSSNLVDV